MRASVRATPSTKPGVYRVLGDTVNGNTCRSEMRTGKDEMIGEGAIEPVQWNPFQLRTSDVCREKDPAWARSNSGICARLGGSDRARTTPPPQTAVRVSGADPGVSGVVSCVPCTVPCAVPCAVPCDPVPPSHVWV